MRSILFRLCIFLCIFLCAGLCAGCSLAAAPRPDGSSSLGTAWGERIASNVHFVTFQREDESRPDAAATIHYDDGSGLRVMTGVSKDHFRSKPFQALNDDVEFGLTDEERFWSPYLPGVERNGDYFVRGKLGDRYAIYVKNRSYYRIEAVLSVDGVDVMNGQTASFAHRGYIINPGDSLIVEGFRDSTNSVAAFRFADAHDSYVAAKHGQSQNAGVIGLAFFSERGSNQFASRPASRYTANPFPGEFATAPYLLR